MLADPGSVVIERFDLRNPVPEWNLGEDRDDPEVQAAVATYVSVVGAGEQMVGIAFPGTFLLDAGGRVVERHFEDFYIERNTISGILINRGEGLDPVEATQVSTTQFDLTTFSSNPEVAPGNRFTLVMNIDPAEGMHIYAPGAQDYQVISLDIEPQPYLDVRPMNHPEAGTYYFEPFDETVPVYEEPFTLLQEVVLKGDPETQRLLRGMDSVTIRGTLRYQACDAEICYTPSELPLAWTLQLRTLVFR